MIDQQRAAFEAWAKSEGIRTNKHADGSYMHTSAIVAYRGYQAALASPEVQALRKDAERYQWLRQQHWSESEMCVVCRPKDTVKLGSYCPSLDLLDSHIDAAMEKQP